MCGITGFVDYSSQPDAKILQLMTGQIIYRGPDSSGKFIDQHVALGIRRLSIIDLVSGDQPISNEDGTVTVVFNGEIYNYIELRAELIKDGHIFKTQSDTEVLVHLYEKYGDQMPKYLNGMFAFAIWDKKDQKLLLARDQVGIKPLYFWRQGERLIFGSEIKTILKNPQVKFDINKDSLNLYFFMGYIPGEFSIFEKINKLLPGYLLIFKKNGIKIKKYYEVPFTNDGSDNFEELFTDSVRRQSISDVPLGVFLSGGIDSTLVTYYLTKVSKDINTFSISFKEKSFNEGIFAFEVAKILGTKHHNDYYAVDDLLGDFEGITRNLDEPFADPSLFPTFKLSKFTRNKVKVALSGDGGDELFGGYPTYRGHLWAQKLAYTPKFTSTLFSKLLALLPRSDANYPVSEVIQNFITGLYLQPVQRHLSWMSPTSLNPIFSSVKGNSWYEDCANKINDMDVDIVRKMRFLDFMTYLPDDLLVKVDRASMYNSLEVRVPFLDPRIIKFAFSAKHKHVDIFKTKKLLRRILNTKFPKEIIERQKKGFGIPLAKWLCNGLYDLAYEHLQEKRLEEYFRREDIDQIWDEHQRRKTNNSKTIWMLVILSAWFNNWAS